MSKSQFMRIALIASSVLIMIGVGLTGWLVATVDDNSVIKVSLDNEETEAVAFETLSLIPGASCEYTIKLKKGSQKKKQEFCGKRSSSPSFFVCFLFF